MTTGPAAAAEAVEEVARTSYGRLVAYLASTTGDLAGAEDALGDALLAALRTWPDRGVPDRPDSWLLTAARRNIIDAARRRDVARRALPAVARAIEERAHRPEADAIPDQRLRLMFACAHPAIDPAMHSPLMLQAVLGLDAARMSAAFVVPPATMSQRLVRAKAKLRDAGIPFRIPDADELPERLDAVLDAVFAAYGTGWEDAVGTDALRQELTAEALRLARLVVELLPAEPETHGVLALLLHSHARRPARRDASGNFVPLSEQDVARWSPGPVAEAERHLATALSLGRVGPYQLQAAIQSVHNRRALTGQTDWTAVASLYDGLVALELLAGLPPDQASRYQPYWVLLARCQSDLGLPEGAATAARAIELTELPDVRRYLEQVFET